MQQRQPPSGCSGALLSVRERDPWRVCGGMASRRPWGLGAPCDLAPSAATGTSGQGTALPRKQDQNIYLVLVVLINGNLFFCDCHALGHLSLQSPSFIRIMGRARGPGPLVFVRKMSHRKVSVHFLPRGKR